MKFTYRFFSLMLALMLIQGVLISDFSLCFDSDHGVHLELKNHSDCEKHSSSDRTHCEKKVPSDHIDSCCLDLQVTFDTTIRRDVNSSDLQSFKSNVNSHPPFFQDKWSTIQIHTQSLKPPLPELRGQLHPSLRTEVLLI